MEEYPPNSDKSKLGEYEDRNVKRVTSSEPIRRRKPLGKQFKKTFFGGDARTAAQFVLFGVLIPAAKDMIVDAGREGLERLVHGDSKRRRSSPPSGPQGYVSYNRYAMHNQQQQQEAPRSMSRRARSHHDFDEIVLMSRQEAEEVIERLFDLVSQYGSATVSDLYELVGLQSSHTDFKWGWSDVRGAGVSRVRNGYLLDLPEPEPLTS